jgi:hypothetical protein
MRLRRVARFVGALAALGALLRSAPSCTSDSIVIASIPVSDAGKTTPPPLRCTDNSDCPKPTFCSKTACTDTTGTCELPAVCGDEPYSPECACSNGVAPGVTYFSDCLRQSAGESSYTAGECTFEEAQLCGEGYGGACPDPTESCAQLSGFKGACQTNFPGTCWVLPATCPTPPPPDRWDSCTTSATCVDTCTAIATGGAYRRAPPCSPPPGGP